MSVLPVLEEDVHANTPSMSDWVSKLPRINEELFRRSSYAPGKKF